jgi:hypothetical protein
MPVIHHRHGPSPCPICAKALDVATGRADTVTPKPGDFTLCDGCGSVLRFAEDMQLRATTQADLAEMPEELQGMRQRWLKSRRVQ